MRRIAVAVLIFLSASALFAQQQPKNDFSIFVTNVRVTHTNTTGTSGSASVGLGFDRMVSPRLSVQAAIEMQRGRTYSYIVNPDGSFTQISPQHFHTYPFDVNVRYHYLTESRWKPFAGIGVRYVAKPKIGSEFRYQSHFGPELVGGTVVQLSRSFGLLLEGRIYGGDHEPYDDPFKISFGLNWRF